jgi:hypothetical protein
LNRNEERNNDLNPGDSNGGEIGMQEQDHRNQDHREDSPPKEEDFQDIEKQYQFILSKAEFFSSSRFN